jgi:phosphoribosylaminoimidazole-succinocarboxamide synthase
MKKGKLIYEGKAKKVFATDKDDLLLITFKDDLTAFDGSKKGSMKGKGLLTNRVSFLLFKLLEHNGIDTHLEKQIDERSTLVKKLDMIPVEVVVRNRVAGSLCQRIGKDEGFILPSPILEFYYKNDSLHDPMINAYHILVMNVTDEKRLEDMKIQALNINKLLQVFFDSIDIILVDFKLEFGVFNNQVILGDEISPDTCRLWDKNNLKRLDKDRFRWDMGQERESYQEILSRIESTVI